jgi:hypothetical protein
MPIQTGTIADIQQDVIDALQGRTDISATQIANYAAKTIREITESYPFEELRTTGPNFSLTLGQAIYPIQSFLNPPDDYTLPESFAVYVDFPNNTVIANLDYKTPKSIELMIAPATLGLPSRWTRYGSNIHIGPTPNNPYVVFMRYQIRHRFSNPPALTDPIFLPQSWYDVIAYGTAERIAIIKRWTDQRQELHDLIWGDPEFVNSDGKKGRPGLIAAHLFQVERDQKFNTRQIMPTIPRYNSR